jgi:hypothetical protein
MRYGIVMASCIVASNVRPSALSVFDLTGWLFHDSQVVVGARLDGTSAVIPIAMLPMFLIQRFLSNQSGRPACAAIPVVSPDTEIATVSVKQTVTACCLLLVTEHISTLPPIAGARRVALPSVSASGTSTASALAGSIRDDVKSGLDRVEVDLLAQLLCRDRVIEDTRRRNTTSFTATIGAASARLVCTEFVWRRSEFRNHACTVFATHDSVANGFAANDAAAVAYEVDSLHGTGCCECGNDGADREAEGDALFAALAEHGYFRVALTPDEWRIFDAAHMATHTFFAQSSADERKQWVQVFLLSPAYGAISAYRFCQL